VQGQGGAGSIRESEVGAGYGSKKKEQTTSDLSSFVSRPSY